MFHINYFSLYINLNAVHLCSHYAALHQQQLDRRPRKTSKMHTNIHKSFLFLLFLFFRLPNSSVCRERNTTEFFSNIKRKLLFFPPRKYKITVYVMGIAILSQSRCATYTVKLLSGSLQYCFVQ